MTGLLHGLLDGITVVDLSQFLPGPMLTRLMADQGARIHKIEPPLVRDGEGRVIGGGDPARHMAPFTPDGDSLWFRQLNAGKHSHFLDLKTDAGKAALEALLGQADVLIEGFRPGVMARLGFDADGVLARHPRLVYASLTAFGQAGVLAHHPAHDMAVQALAGTLALNDGADGRPVVPGVPAADMAVSLTALSAVLMALLARTRTGQGAIIDCAMLDALMPWTAHVAGDALAGGPAPRSASQRSLGGAAFYQVYDTADGGHIVLAGRELAFAHRLLTALGRPDLVPLAALEAGPDQAPLQAFLAATFRTRTKSEWVAWFAKLDVAFAPVRDLREALDDPALRDRGVVAPWPDGTLRIASPIRVRAPEPPPGSPA
jgi:crotonobetainyl-CoA:carnitine CoA-transferase CaiB-like acyl-CoA transferase